jgi:uncharacterized protein
MNTRHLSLALFLSVAAVAARAEDGARPAPAAPATDPAKAADIQRLLEVTGSAQMGEQMLDRLLEIPRRATPQAPTEVWQELRQAMETRELMEIVAGIWDKHFTHEDIKGLIAFYESPLGVRLLEKQPLVLQESMQAGEAWGRRAMEKVQEKLRQKGFTPTRT